MASELPTHHRALVLENEADGFEMKTVPTPQPSLGTAVIQVLASAVLSYSREVYNGERNYPFPKPLVGGAGAVGRVAGKGADATTLKLGQLVFVDCVVRPRDHPDTLFLAGFHNGGTEASSKLARDVWRDGSMAEFVAMPLENCIPLDETRLCQDLGYSYQDLMYLGYLLVPFGGLRNIEVEPGETVLVCPATGGFGGAGVQVAVAMGAKVIAMGRNEKELARLKEQIETTTPNANIVTVKLTGDEATDRTALQAHGPIDAVLDLSPPGANKSTHMKSALAALRYEGRISLMGFVEVPSHPLELWKLIGSNITLKGKLMYTRKDIVLFVKMLEAGLFPKGKGLVETKSFKLEDWRKAFDEAAEYTRLGRSVVLTP